MLAQTTRVLLSALVVGAMVTGSALAQDLERGEELWDLCSSCHGPNGEGDQRFLAPAIAGLKEWYIVSQLEKFQNGLRGGHPDDLAGLRMRPMSRVLRNAEDTRSIASYVAALPSQSPAPTLEGGDPAKGAAFYATCLSCHGVQGEGNKDLFGPRLVNQSDWYMLEQLKKFKSGVRAGDPRDTYGMLMRPMAIALPDEQAMKDVIAHIETLSK